MDDIALTHEMRVPAHKTGRPVHETGKATRVPITMRAIVEWTYAEQRAHQVLAPSVELTGRSQTGIVVDRLLAFAALGCEVDISSRAADIWGETRCHEDALTVHAAVQSLCRRQQQLLITHGGNRMAPDWCPKIFPLACRPAPGKLRRPKTIYDKGGHKQIGSELMFEGDWPDREFAARARKAAETNMRLWPDRHSWCDEPFRRYASEVIERARELYGDWCEALEALQDCLDYSRHHILVRYWISGLGVPRRPWKA